MLSLVTRSQLSVRGAWANLSRARCNRYSLLVILETSEQADYLLSNARQLRRSYDDQTRQHVYINKDLSRAEAHAVYENRCRRRDSRSNGRGSQHPSQYPAPLVALSSEQPATSMSFTANVMPPLLGPGPTGGPSCLPTLVPPSSLAVLPPSMSYQLPVTASGLHWADSTPGLAAPPPHMSFSTLALPFVPSSVTVPVAPSSNFATGPDLGVNIVPLEPDHA